MNVLIDIGHPAHVHIFKGIAKALVSGGNRVHFTVREGERESELLTSYGLPFSQIGRKKRSVSGKVFRLLIFTYKILKVSKREKSDIYLSHGSMYAGIAAFIRRKPHIALEDTGNMEQLFLSRPFSDVILSPDALKLDLGKKHIKYKGFHELFYLCPGCFVPDRKVLSLLGLYAEEPFCIVRFISWGATHDKGHSGLSGEEKHKLIRLLNAKYRVFISSESELPTELEQYRFHLSPEWLHHAIAFSEFVISEGATIAAESTLLGIPVIYINTLEADMIDVHEKYGLLTHVRKPEEMFEYVKLLITNPSPKSEYVLKRDKMLSTQIDCTGFFLWFLENYPGSVRTLRTHPEYQEKFRLKSVQ
jgi:predicted glycosyltransferase